MVLQRIAGSDVFSSLSDVHRLHHQLNRLLSAGEVFAEPNEFPAINVWTSEYGAIVRTEIPGIKSEDIDISLVNDTLTIKGERKPDAMQEGETCHRQERGSGQFSRSIKLPFVVDPDAVKANFSEGVLQIDLPESASEKPRKINVLAD